MNGFKKNNESGFSLVEVALALLVVGIGMLAVLGLFPAGLDMNKKAIDDAQSALFATDVLNGLLTKSQSTSWDSLQSMSINPPATDMWKNASALVVREGKGTNVYEYYDKSVVEYAVRYDLDIGYLPNNNPATDDIAYFRLQVWNGQFGTSSNPAVFYTEIYNSGM